MIELSKQSARRLRHGLLTVILTLGGIPIVLPLVWLALSSLKTADRVLTEEPQWLPLVERLTVADENRECAVTVVERGRADTLGWWRIRPAYVPDHDWFYWPADRIDAVEVTGQVARIGGVMRAVARPTPVEQPGMVRVEQLGTQRVVAVRPGQLTSKSRRVLQILDQEVYFETLARSAESGVEADPQSRAVPIRITQASAPFVLANTRMVAGDGGPCVAVEALGGAEFPLEVLERYQAAGVSRVRFVPGPPVSVDPAHLDARQQTLVSYYLKRDGEEIPVKPTRLDARGEPVAVAVLGQLKEQIVPAANLVSITRQQHSVRWLGQTLSVRTRPDVAAPTGMVALQTVSPDDSAAVACELVRQHASLAPQWSNYINVFHAEPLHKYVLNTLFITALCIVGNVLSCGLVGYAFARLQFRGRDALFLVLLSTMMLPATITFLPTYIVYVKIGWLDTFYPLIVPAYLATSAFFVFLYRQFFMTIPLDLEDAARIDGCGPLATFWHIMLPMARPAVVTVAVFSFMATWNDFMGPLLYLNTDEYQTLAYGLYSFKTSFGYKFPHFMMAASTMMMIPTLIIFFLAQKAFLRGVVVTGVKG